MTPVTDDKGLSHNTSKTTKMTSRSSKQSKRNRAKHGKVATRDPGRPKQAAAGARKSRSAGRPTSAEGARDLGGWSRAASAGGTTGSKKRDATESAKETERATYSDERALYDELPPGRRAPLRRALRQIAVCLTEPEFQRSVSEEGFKQQTLIALQTFRVITRGRGRALQSVIDALDPLPPDDPGSIDLEGAEERGHLRLQALYRKIVTDSYSVADLHSLWGISRQRLGQLRSEDRLFAIDVPYHRSLLYPRWQFGEDHRPRPVMPRLIGQAKSTGLDPIEFHQLMTNPSSGAGVTPVRLLDQGEEELVLEVIRGTDA